MALRQPRPILTQEEMLALSPEEQAVAVAEWRSYLAGVKIEKEREQQEQQAGRGSYRGGRARGGRGRGRGYYNAPSYQPYTRSPHQRPYHNLTATFNEPATASAPSTANGSPRIAPKTTTINKSEEPREHATKAMTLCPAFTSTGICARPRCYYVHDPDKTAICKQFLFKGTCPKGSSCPLSHEPSPRRSPNCVHFQNDYCNKDDCPYAHVHVNPDALVCEAFGRLGYCEKGDQCADRHAFECPDYTNKGACNFNGCRLPHIKHAGRLRKARKPSAETESPSDMSSPEKEEVVDHTHALTQQVDFVPFES